MNVFIDKIVLHQSKMSHIKPIHAGQMSYMNQNVFAYLGIKYRDFSKYIFNIKSSLGIKLWILNMSDTLVVLHLDT